MITVNLQETQLKLYEKLKPSGWGDKLKTFILSSEFENILTTLLNEVNENKRFTPPLKQVFRAFETCNLNNLKVIIIGQDPFPQPYVADGLAFSCSNIGKPEVSLKFIFKALEDTVYPDGYTWDPDLERWANQGVLLLNTALTTTMSKIGVHYDLWKPFIEFLLDYLTINNPGLCYAFFGKKAQAWADYIPDNNHKLYTSHPASAGYKNLDKWDCNDIFNKINIFVQNQFNTKIIW